jgi:hypothetical protein
MSTSSFTAQTIQQRPCPHCGATGTCDKGIDKQACGDCIRRFAIPSWKRWFTRKYKDADIVGPKGCWCGVCGAKGFIEGATFKLRNYFPFLFASTFVICCFVLFGFKHDVPDKIGSALTTIMGTIVGFYFGGKKD